MTVRKPNPFLFLGVLTAALAAGCGTVTSAPHTAASSGSTAVTVSSRPSGPAKQRAAADAKAILGKFVPPPGAVRLAKRPRLPSGSPVMILASTTQVDATGYWRASGSVTALLAWEKAHISRSFAREDGIIGPPSWNTVYTLPPVPGVLPKREMNVQFYDTGGAQTVIMAEAMVEWQPPRPAADVIPSSVTEVTVKLSGLVSPPAPAPVTITSVSAVRRLAALVNGLPLSTVAEGVPCPMATGFTLTFRTARGGPPAAVVDGPGACSEVTFTLDGKNEPPLLPADAGAYKAAVLKIAGLHWKLS
ncbi:MAG TPA: hypothetical protein VH594_23990 [Trebonia sp.]|jgi:hypothetical protein